MRGAAVTSRRRDSHRGTIMIMVVALLVLLALMGTAWIASVSTDRSASRANTANTQADLHLDGLSSIVQARVGLSDLLGWQLDESGQPTGEPLFRPRSDSARRYTYVPWTCPMPDGVDPDPIAAKAQEALASRTPSAQTQLDGLTLNRDASGKLTVSWPAISAPLSGMPRSVASDESPLFRATRASVEFESPWNPDPPAAGPMPLRYSQRLSLRPTFITLSVNGVPTSHPAFLLSDGTRVLAADTDGDGIADSGLWPAPGGPGPDGINWYYAARIIDNNSAINANTAFEWARPEAAEFLGIVRTNLFPVNIDLAGFANAAGVNRLNRFRFGGTFPWAGPFEWPNYRPLVDDSGASLPSLVTDPNVTYANLIYLHWASAYDVLWHQLGRRPDNPGFSQPNQKCRALSIDNQLALGYRFVYANRDAFGDVEQALYPYLEGPAGANGQALSFNQNDADVTRWFDKNFNYLEESDPMPNSADGRKGWSRRAQMVVRNGVSNQFEPAGTFLSTWATAENPFDPTKANPRQITPLPSCMANYGAIPVKTSVNTASANELWLAFWNVMADRVPPLDSPPAIWSTWDTTPFAKDNGPAYANIPDDPYYGMHFNGKIDWVTGNSEIDPVSGKVNADPIHQLHPARMFRSPIRDPNASGPKVWIDPSQMLLLRSAIAAFNTRRHRNGNWYYCADSIFVGVLNGFKVRMGNESVMARVRIFPWQPQPCIAEIYVNTDNTEHVINGQRLRNPKGYIAIELYAPDDWGAILTGWKIATITREGSGSSYKAKLDILGPITIPRTPNRTNNLIRTRDHLVIENYVPGTPDNNSPAAQYRPDPAARVADLKNEPDSWDAHVGYLPNLADCIGKELVILRPVLVGTDPGTSAAALSQYVPVDQFDLRGISLPSSENPIATGWHYVRNTATVQTIGWDNAWYPGPSSRCIYPGRYWGNRPLGPGEGTWHHQGTQQEQWSPQAQEPWVQKPPDPPVTLGTENATASYPTEFSIPDGWQESGPDAYPFLGLPRVGDLTRMPFIAGYTIQRMAPDVAANEFIEVNSVPMDAAFAEDTDTADDAVENIGRFCPPLPSATKWMRPDDPLFQHYGWATKIFDCFTVFALHQDFMPNMSEPGALYFYEKWMGASPFRTPPVPLRAIGNADVQLANSINERLLGVEGLVNINTASWRVLAAVPFAPENASENEHLAREIVRWRDGDGVAPANGPFKSLFDLYRVSAVRQYVSGLIGRDFGAYTSGYGYVVSKGDFGSQYMFLTRISNLLTTRSDTFTCYLTVQGWKRAGTANPQLVAQRRMGIVLDRTGVTPDALPARGGVSVQQTGIKTTVFPND